MENITQLGKTMQHMWQFIEIKIGTISRTTLLYGKTGSLLVVVLVVHTLLANTSLPKESFTVALTPITCFYFSSVISTSCGIYYLLYVAVLHTL